MRWSRVCRRRLACLDERVALRQLARNQRNAALFAQRFRDDHVVGVREVGVEPLALCLGDAEEMICDIALDFPGRDLSGQAATFQAKNKP